VNEFQIKSFLIWFANFLDHLVCNCCTELFSTCGQCGHLGGGVVWYSGRNL